MEKVSFARKSFNSVVRLVTRFFQCFKYAYVVYILVFLDFVWFVCFYELLNRRVQNLVKHPSETTDLVTFTGEILNAKLHFLCSDVKIYYMIEIT